MASTTYDRFTLRMAVQLAAPHTWPAAILPCLIAICAAGVFSDGVSLSMACVLLAICILMQSSVNTFNDYYDYVKGADSAADDVEESDATLVYNNVNPRSALTLGIGFLVAAFALGSYVIFRAGWIPLAIGVVGAVFVVVYSAGKTPLSYLPLGEIVSGTVMGGLIPLACYQALTGNLDWMMLVWALPEIIGVALIMMTNNTCDIEKDVVSQRRTLPVLIGRAKARRLYHGALVAWLAIIGVECLAFFPTGAIVLPFMYLAAYPLLKALFANPLAPASRIGAMAQICSVNIALGSFYACCIAANGMAPMW
ncbi:MAG: prenyltransferase [Slackia sp.]|nr:prenyltransferase [Slackia sp.]